MPIAPDVLIAMGGREWVTAIAAALGAFSILLGLLNCRRAIGQTTLIYAWGWSAAACLAILSVEVAACLISPSAGWISPLRFCAAALSFCPMISVLGSKRPQHVPWNFVVLSLWGIVSLSALTALAMQRSDRFVLGDARAWLLWVLILIGLANYLPTRNWLPALLAAAGQVFLFAAHLPLVSRIEWLSSLQAAPAIGLLLFAAAMMTAVRRKGTPQDPYDVLWRDFRDALGLLWGLRMQERINAAAQAAGWDLELAWGGFIQKGNPKEPGMPAELRPVMKGLLRRFVSNEWIAARLGEDIN